MNHHGTALPPTGLLVDLLRDPNSASLTSSRPSFSWIVRDRAPNMHQTAWQIAVASRRELLLAGKPDLWDSGARDPGTGWQTDSRSLHLRYEGNPLAPQRDYWWRVRTWNSRGERSPWSEPQCFHVGELRGEYVTARQDLVRVSQAPIHVVLRDDGVTFVDFGKAAFGTVVVELTAAGAGEVRIRLGEVLAAPFTVHRHPGGSRRYREILLSVEPGRQRYEIEIEPDTRNTCIDPERSASPAILMPAAIGEVLPFRYVEIEGPVVPPDRAAIRRLAVFYPFDEQAAAFHSSSHILDDVWELCHYSMKATSFCGVHVDGDRERIPYEGDVYINQLGQYYCDREFALSRYSHEYLITRPTWPTEWILFSVQTAWLDYLYTGDSRSLETYYEDLRAKTLCDLRREDGLISTVDPPVSPDILAGVHMHPKSEMRDIVDWPQGERDGYRMQAVNTVVNAFHWRALILMERIALALDRRDEARVWRERADLTRATMLAELVDAETGLFVDGAGTRHSALHATIFPLAFGLTPPEMVPPALEHIRRKGMACSVYAAQFLLEALYRGGDEHTALAMLTSTAERAWAHWIYDVGSTITLEAWSDRFKPNQDWNHAWGAAPANVIPRFILGVRPLLPGFENVLIRPRAGSLSSVAGRVPTIRGPIEIRYEQIPGERFSLEFSLPANTTCRVEVPRLHPTHHTVWVDGRPQPAIPDGDRLVLDGLGSGRHIVGSCAAG